ncbi:hypothetical protein [Bacillus paramycoides]|uniref:hypothetical protein n=1 Tax=Bacillus paramycoides TaxID=2026194 RepID=UPI00380C1F1D
MLENFAYLFAVLFFVSIIGQIIYFWYKNTNKNEKEQNSILQDIVKKFLKQKKIKKENISLHQKQQNTNQTNEQPISQQQSMDQQTILQQLMRQQMMIEQLMNQQQMNLQPMNQQQMNLQPMNQQMKIEPQIQPNKPDQSSKEVRVVNVSDGYEFEQKIVLSPGQDEYKIDVKM